MEASIDLSDWITQTFPDPLGFGEAQDRREYMAARALVVAIGEKRYPPQDPYVATATMRFGDAGKVTVWPNGGPTLADGDAAFEKGAHTDAANVLWTHEDMVFRARAVLSSADAPASPAGALDPETRKQTDLAAGLAGAGPWAVAGLVALAVLAVVVAVK